MITYYLYGRGKDGYMNYNPEYTKADEDHYFLKMAGYTGNFEVDQPEKRFFYQVQTEERGKCSIIGKTSPVKMYSSVLSGARDTVFSFQYLLSDTERVELVCNPSMLHEYMFPDNMDQIHRTKEGTDEISLDNAVLDLNYFFKQNGKQSASLYDYSMEELIQAFNLDESRLEQFIYTMMLFNTEEKVYFVLPDNTKKSTDMAFSLMCKVLSILPESIVQHTGFVTYVNEVEKAGADFVPYEIRYMFLTDTPANRAVCASTRSAYVFCLGCETGIEIPASMQEIVTSLAEMFKSGKTVQSVMDLWGALNRYLRQDVILPVSTVEYCALDAYCRIYRSIADENNAQSKFTVDEVWKNIDILRSMSIQRTDLWCENLAQDLTIYVREIIDCDYVDDSDGYNRIFAEYSADSSLHACIEEFFYRKVSDYAQLEKYLPLLEGCPELRKKVYEHARDMLVELLDSGEVDQSMYSTLLGIYNEKTDLQSNIQKFFVDKIAEENSFLYFQDLITTPTQYYSANNNLWETVESEVYQKVENYKFILDLERRRIGEILGDTSLFVESLMRIFWDRINRVYRLNRNILLDEEYFYEINASLRIILGKWIEPAVMRGILVEAENKLNNLFLPKEYSDLFVDISDNYLKTYRDRICLVSNEAELFFNWPFIDRDNSTNILIVKTLQDKKMAEDNLLHFEEVIKFSNAAGIYRYLISQENVAVLEQVVKTKDLPSYVEQITRRLEKEVMIRDKLNSARDCYDELCGQLIMKFSEQTRQVLRYIMISSYGGVKTMSNVYSYIKKNGSMYDITQEAWLEMKRMMSEEILLFFKTHKMSRTDKKDIKEEKEFLQKIGLYYKNILKR